MKLIEYRFNREDVINSFEIATNLQSIFVREAAGSLLYISDNERVIKNIAAFSEIMAGSFKMSFSRTVDHNRPHSAKSLSSCRFVVIEDDGVVRICLSNDDDILQFGGLTPDVANISSMMLETDLFDYL